MVSCAFLLLLGLKMACCWMDMKPSIEMTRDTTSGLNWQTELMSTLRLGKKRGREPLLSAEKRARSTKSFASVSLKPAERAKLSILSTKLEFAIALYPALSRHCRSQGIR